MSGGAGMSVKMCRRMRMRSQETALHLFRAAAARGETYALLNLGLFYAEGRCGLKRDNRRAVRFFLRGAWQGDTAAQVALGDMYWRGEGVKRDRATAMQWWMRARRGNPSGL